MKNDDGETLGRHAISRRAFVETLVASPDRRRTCTGCAQTPERRRDSGSGFLSRRRTQGTTPEAPMRPARSSMTASCAQEVGSVSHAEGSPLLSEKWAHGSPLRAPKQRSVVRSLGAELELAGVPCLDKYGQDGFFAGEVREQVSSAADLSAETSGHSSNPDAAGEFASAYTRDADEESLRAEEPEPGTARLTRLEKISVAIAATRRVIVEGLVPGTSSSGSSSRSCGARMGRISTTLQDKALLRATPTATLLGCFGRRLQQSVGGISTSESGDSEYDKSFTVNEIDYFLSHSWHAKWWLKYLTLLFYFNGVPALLAAALTGICVFGVRYREAQEHPSDKQSPFCLSIGFVVFASTLLTWHRISATLQLSPKIFLDKVCIHQTDASQKINGIKSIGGFLAFSKCLLVMWDATYFERLWCTYEVAAYQYANKNAKITILPVVLGGFVTAYIIGTLISDCLWILMYNYWDLVRNTPQYLNCALVGMAHFPCFIFVSWVFIRYAEDMYRLKHQLRIFSVTEAKCFCCCHGHVHPETGQPLVCDRELVNDAIARWWDPMGRHVEGLENFNDQVRNQFGIHVKVTMGGYAKIPYRFAATASVLAALNAFDAMLVRSETPLIFKALHVFEAAALRHPINIAMLLFTVRKQVNGMPSESLENGVWRVIRLKETKGIFISSVGFGLVFTCIYFSTLLVSAMVRSQGSLAVSACWTSLEVFMISILYFRKHLYQVFTRRSLFEATAAKESRKTKARTLAEGRAGKKGVGRIGEPEGSEMTVTRTASRQALLPAAPPQTAAARCSAGPVGGELADAFEVAGGSVKRHADECSYYDDGGLVHLEMSSTTAHTLQAQTLFDGEQSMTASTTSRSTSFPEDFGHDRCEIVASCGDDGR